MEQTASNIGVPAASEVEVYVHTWKEWPELAQRWADLHERTAGGLFLDPAWVETWIEIFGEQLRPELLFFRCGDEDRGACLIGSRNDWSRYIPLRRIYLNCAGEPEHDSTFVEYNRLMCLPGWEEAVSDALWEHLGAKAWDEFVLAGTEVDSCLQQLEARGAKLAASEDTCWFINLGELRQSGVTYDAVLSANTRQQVRKSIRLYADLFGSLSLKVITDYEAAARALDELAGQHQASWRERGERGAFHSDRFRKFHQSLIRRLAKTSSVNICIAKAGERPIGFLYNILAGRRLYFYQSGFAYEEDRRLKPGLVTHYLAVSHYLTERPDVDEYDFLAGDSQYKRSLAKQSRILRWSVIQMPTWRVRGVAALSRLRRTFKRLRQTCLGGGSP